MPVIVQSKEPFGVLIKKTKDTKKGGQKGLFLVFLGLSSPKSKFGSPGPPNNFKATGLARLGEQQPPQGGLYL